MHPAAIALEAGQERHFPQQGPQKPKALSTISPDKRRRSR